jgi:hypothetical protein
VLVAPVPVLRLAGLSEPQQVNPSTRGHATDALSIPPKLRRT